MKFRQQLVVVQPLPTLISKNNSEHSHVCLFKKLGSACSSSVSDASRAAVVSISAVTGSVMPFL